ncbi:MAG: hypothetical protein WDN08_21625 [Rhizomicrobium sp.]
MNFLYSTRPREFLVVRVVEKINVLGKDVLGWKHDLVKVAANVAQFAVALLEQKVRRDRIDDDIKGHPLALDPDRPVGDIELFDAGRQQNLCFGRRHVKEPVVAVGRIGVSGIRRVPRRPGPALDRHALGRPVEGIDLPVVVDQPHLLIVLIDEFIEQSLADELIQ